MNKNLQTPSWEETLEMIKHWVSVPENGYLGSSYGGRTLLVSCIGVPPKPDVITKVIAKLKEDVKSISNELITLNWNVNNSDAKILKIIVGNCSAEIQVV